MSATLPFKRPVSLDGGMGREFRFRGVDVMRPIWSASALLDAPEIVRAVHRDFIAAGADVITTNTYGVIRADLAREGMEDRFAALNTFAGKLAVQARDEARRPVLIASSLPPLRGSYRPDLVGPFAEIEPLYREQAAFSRRTLISSSARRCPAPPRAMPPLAPPPRPASRSGYHGR